MGSQVAQRGRLKIFLGYASGVDTSARMLDEARRRQERGQDVVIADVPPDIESILRRHPGFCVIDGLTAQNTGPLLDAGINVIGSITIQHVEQLPLEFIRSADEIVVVDAPADEPQTAALREVALVAAADVVDHQLDSYLEEHGLAPQPGAMERILVCVTPRANVDDMLRTARAVATRFHGEVIAAYVRQPVLSEADQAALDAKLDAARKAGASVEVLEEGDPVDVLLDFSKMRKITQLFIGHTQRRGLWARLRGSPVDDLIRRSEGMDIRVFPQRT